MALLLRPLLACLLLAPSLHALTVDLVTTLCHETSLAWIDDAAARLSLVKGTSVSKHVYCKCGPRPECSAELPNVGRETHAFLSHVAAVWDRAADYSLFVNGGFGSKEPAREDFEVVLATLGRRLARGKGLRFLDASWEQGEEPFQLRQGSSAEFHRSVAEECKGPAACCQGLCEKSYCCRLFGLSICPEGQQRLYDEQRTCSWLGKTEENNGEGLTRLRAANPNSFDLWLERHWDVNVQTFEFVQWRPYSIFAASRAALLSHRRGTYQRLAAHMERTGATDSMAGHYMERSWRVIFSVRGRVGPGGAVHESHHELHAPDGEELRLDAEVDRQEALAFEAAGAAGAAMAEEERRAMEAGPGFGGVVEEVALLAGGAGADAGAQPVAEAEEESDSEDEEGVAESALDALIEARSSTES